MSVSEHSTKIEMHFSSFSDLGDARTDYVQYGEEQSDATGSKYWAPIKLSMTSSWLTRTLHIFNF